MKKKLPILLLLLITSSYSQTYMSAGSVSGTWSSQNSPYYIHGDITIPNDSTLIIEPGVDVIFDGHYGLFVQGRLLAIGTSSDRISLSVSDTTGFYNSDTTSGGWYGIRFIDTPEQNDTSKIIYCDISYGKAVGQDWFFNAGGGFCILHFDKVIISNCTITNCSAGGNGFAVGGALAVGWSDIQLTNNRISYNKADAGGAIHFYESNPVLLNNVVEFNSAKDAGAFDIQTKSHANFINNEIINNNASGTGGAINVVGDSVYVNFDNCKISTNEAGTGGGINISGTTAFLNMNKCVLIENSARDVGGCINSWQGQLEIDSCEFSNSISGINGGGINAEESNIILTNCVFKKDTSTQLGGAIAVRYSNLSSNNLSFSENGAGIRGGGLYAENSEIYIKDSKFQKDTITIFGAAIQINYSNMLLENCSFKENYAGILGGAIHSDFSDMKISKCVFDSDSAGDAGGGIFAWQSKLSIDNCDFNYNVGKYRGGAITIDSTNSLITNNSFSNGDAMWGGAIAVYRSDILVNNNYFNYNDSEHGGAINCEYSNLKLKQNSLNQNSSIWGGAISSINCNLQIDSCLFYQNTASNQGGAIEYISDTTGITSICQFEINNTKFEENTASTRCAAAIVEQYNSTDPLVKVLIDKCEFINNDALRIGVLRFGNISDFTISNSEFVGNQAAQHSAACTFANYSRGSIYNCLFAQNVANVGSAGGAGVSVFSNVNFMNCTFVNNKSSSGGGIQLRQGGKAIITNSIFWGNFPDQISLLAVNDTSDCKVYLNYNDVQFGKDSIKVNDAISVVEWGIGNIDSDPLFVDTLSNDFHLQSVSPCLAAGIDSIQVAGIWQHAPLSDIEGNVRPFPFDTKPDLGVYESQYPVSVKDVKTNLPNEFVLYQNYPNPFNSSSEIKYSIPKSSKVVLKIFNVLGNEITTLVKEEKSVGTYKIKWLADDVPSGVYFYQLKTGDYSETKKMILLK